MAGRKAKKAETDAAYLKVYLRVMAAGEIALGPGKADLMEAIDRHGSMAGAGKEMGISYRRVWDMVEAVNNGFETPLIVTTHGGKHGGGAALSETGHQVLSLYRAMQTAVEQAAAAHYARIAAFLKPQG